MINELLQTYNSWMTTTFSNNEMLVGIVSGMLLGMITYSIKTYPSKLFYFILKHISRTLELSSDSYVYTDVMDVLKTEGIFIKARNLRLKNGVWGWSKTHEETLGLGIGWYFLRGNLVQINVYQEDMNSDRVIHTMKLRVLGNGLEVINKIIDDSNAKLKDETKTNIYKVIDNKIELYNTQHRYTMKDVILSKDTEEAIQRAFDFAKNEDYYKENSMTWKYGVMLHGIHGAGKTKLAKCIAGELGWDILNISSISDFANLPKLDSETVVIVEEIDKMIGASKEVDEKGEPIKTDDTNDSKTNSTEVVTNMMKGDFLTSIDGVSELHGVLIIATTNHLEYLHPAMYRDGRMDEVIEFTNMGMYEFEKFFNKYYPGDTIPDSFELGEVTGSMLEKSKKQRLTKDEFLNKFSKK